MNGDFDGSTMVSLSVMAGINYTLRQGFTIVELLIVVVVIAILAAITVVSYSGIQKSATTSAVKAELANNGKLLEMYRVENSQYPAPPTLAIGISFTETHYNLTRNNLYYCANPTTDQFALSAVQKGENSKGFAYISGQGVVEMPAIDQSLTCGKVGVSTYSNGTTTPIGYTAAGSVWGSWIKH